MHLRLKFIVRIFAAVAMFSTATFAALALPGAVAPLLTPEPGFGGTPLPSPVPAPLESGLGSEAAVPDAGSRGIRAPKRNPFRIGYIPIETEGGLSPGVAHRLEVFLEENSRVRAQLLDNRFALDIAMQAADGHNDLKANLDSRQCELAFCPAAVFASLDAGYQPILQERRRWGIWDSRARGENSRTGVLIAGRASPLFDLDRPSSATLKRVMTQSDLAVPSAFDAAGFHYPLLALWRQAGLAPSNLRLRFCGSSEEVVKHVASGLALHGACDSAAVAHWLPEAIPDEFDAADLVRILPIKIPPTPTDPVIIRDSLRPEVSPLGEALKRAVSEFFRESQIAPFSLDLNTRPEFYDRLRQDLVLLEQAFEEASNR